MLFCLIGGNLEWPPAPAQGSTVAAINGGTVPAWLRASMLSKNPPSSPHSSIEFPNNTEMHWAAHFLCYIGVRTGSSFDSNFQNDFDVARGGHISPNSCGTVLATRAIAQPVLFLIAATSRGPPLAGNQNLHVINGELDRPARHLHAIPLFSKFPFYNPTSVRNATCPFILHRWLAGLEPC
jgi:hypothetical protein